MNFTSDPGYVGPASFDYTFSDIWGETATATVYVDVTNAAPTVDNPVVSTHAGTPLSIGSGAGGPDSDDLTFVGASNVSHGVLESDGGWLNFTPEAGFVGTVSFDFIFSDPYGAMATGIATIEFTNTPPTASDESYVFGRGADASGNVLSAAADPDGDNLIGYQWTMPANGSVSIGTDGSFTYTPNEGYIGTDTFMYAVEDGYGGMATATITVEIANAAPIASDQGYTTRGVSVTGNLLDGASDAEGDPLTAYLSDFPAENGSLSVNADGGYSTSFTCNDLLLPLVLGAPVPKVSFEVGVDFTHAPTLGGYDLKIFFDVGDAKELVGNLVVDDKMTSDEIADKITKQLQANAKLKDRNFTVETDGTQGIEDQGGDSIGSFRFETRDVLGDNVAGKLLINPKNMPVKYTDKEVK